MENLMQKYDYNPKTFKELNRSFEVLGINALFGSDCAVYFTENPDIIAERMDIMRDVLEIPTLCGTLEELCRLLREYSDYVMMKKGKDTAELLSQLTVIRIYFGLVDSMAEKFGAVIGKIKSSKLKALANEFISEKKSPEYEKAKANNEVVGEKLINIKSITVGINLASNLKPTEAGLISINDEYYKSGSFIDKLLRLDFRKSDYDCLAPLTTVEANDIPGEEQAMMNRVILRAMNDVLSAALKNSSLEMKNYVDGKLRDYNKNLPDLKFIISAAKVYLQFREKNIPICYPAISRGGEYRINGIINHRLAFVKANDKIVKNDVVFDEKGRVYVLTGPNSGGKTVYVNALGAAQIMFGLGMPVLAKSATMSPVDGVFLQFPSANAKEMIKNESGRLEEECREISEILDSATDKSLVLFDETFSSTNSKDSITLAAHTVERLLSVGCRSVFSTHIHELVDRIIDADGKNQMAGADLLAAEILNGEKTYRILRGRAEKTGDALTIAQKYGII